MLVAAFNLEVTASIVPEAHDAPYIDPRSGPMIAACSNEASTKSDVPADA